MPLGTLFNRRNKPATRYDALLMEFEEEWTKGDREKASFLAGQCVDAYPDEQAEFRALSIEELVALVDEARVAGDTQRRVAIDVYLLARFAPRTITGTMRI